MTPVLLISGSSGIAEQTALLANAYRVFVVGREEQECRSLSARVKDSGWHACDLRDECAVDRAFQACLDRFGKVDALFNVAGISGRRFGDGPVHECSLEGWETTFSTNARSMFLLCRAATRHWLACGKEGAILNMASVLADWPDSIHFATHAYAASKGAVISLTRAMASYYAPHRIRVNAISPALVRTPMSARAQADAQVLEYVRRRQPLSEGMLEPCEIAKAALFLLGPDSRQITGQVLTVDGGWSVSG